MPVISDCLQLQSNCHSFRTACNYSQIASHFGLPATTVKLPVISDCLQHQSKCQSFRTACNSLQHRAAVLNSDWSSGNLPASACKCLQVPATGFCSENFQTVPLARENDTGPYSRPYSRHLSVHPTWAQVGFSCRWQNSPPLTIAAQGCRKKIDTRDEADRSRRPEPSRLAAKLGPAVRQGAES